MNEGPLEDDAGKPDDVPFDRRKFAAERSHQNASIGYDHAKAVAQAAILINGGAATAILAFLKEASASVKGAAPYSLAIYAAGVTFGALMMFATFRSNHLWNMYWQEVATFGKGNHPAYAQPAVHWRWAAFAAFGLSIACFNLASFVLAYAFGR